MTKFICDVCGREIDKPDEGVILWNLEFSDNGHEKTMKDFQIVHKLFTGYACDDRSRRCSYGKLPDTKEALEFWLLRLNPKFNTSDDNRKGNRTVIDQSIFEGMLRTLIPGYEEARFYADDYALDVFGERDGYGIHLTPEGIKDILKWAKKEGLR